MATILFEPAAGADPSEDSERPLQVYIDSNGRYYCDNKFGEFNLVSETQLKRRLGARGFKTAVEIEDVLVEILDGSGVDYVGSIAGMRTGFHKVGNAKVLVTRAPKLVRPKAGDWFHLRELISTLLPGEQNERFLGWLSWALKGLHAQRVPRGQANIIVGPANCGKTLLASLITEILGGRSCNPLDYMTGQTNFNGEMSGAEHLVIDDDISDTSPKVRKRFAGKLRQLAAAREHRVHPKNRSAVTLRPFWRLTILLNDDPTSLSVLPQLEDSIKDKVNIFHACRATLPVIGLGDAYDRETRLWEKLTSELPAFAHYLLNEHEIPEEWRHERFGVSAFLSPDVRDMLEDPAEVELLRLLVKHWAVLSEGVQEEPTGTFHLPTKDIEQALGDCERKAADRLFYGSNICGLLMSKLVQKCPSHFERRVRSGYSVWMIKDPRQGLEDPPPTPPS